MGVPNVSIGRGRRTSGTAEIRERTNTMSGRILHAVMVMATVASRVVSPVFAQDHPATPPPQSGQPGVLPPPPQYQPPAETQGPPAAPTRSIGFSTAPDYSRPNPMFPNPTAPFRPIRVEKPVLVNSPRVDQLIQSGKLNLSLEDAISLGLENNLGIAVSRYTPWLDEASLLYAKSGINGRFPLGYDFDPVLTGTFSLAQTATPVNNPFLAGVGASTAT